jgi:hypothetical protein
VQCSTVARMWQTALAGTGRLAGNFERVARSSHPGSCAGGYVDLGHARADSEGAVDSLVATGQHQDLGSRIRCHACYTDLHTIGSMSMRACLGAPNTRHSGIPRLEPPSAPESRRHRRLR